MHVLCSPLPACSSLCGGGTGVAPGSRGPPSSSLMHCVMKLASGIAPDNSSVQKLAFSLLANLAMSRDCRGLLQKVPTCCCQYETKQETAAKKKKKDKIMKTAFRTNKYMSK